MSSVELQQAREVQQAPTPEPENKKAGMNGDTSPVLKSSAKPPKGIMGMFANKSAPKSQDNTKEMKPEKKEDVRLCQLLFRVLEFLLCLFIIVFFVF